MFREPEEILDIISLELRQTEALEAIAKYLSYLTGDPCESCERITQDEAYQLVIENPPERGP